MGQQPKDRSETIGIELGPDARHIFIGDVEIRGADRGIVDHSTNAVFKDVTLVDVRIGMSMHGIGTQVDKILIQTGLMTLAREVDPRAVEAALGKSLSAKDVRTAMGIFDDLRTKGVNVLNGIENNALYRSARIATVAIALGKAIGHAAGVA